MRDRAQLLRILGVLTLGGVLATIFVVVPVLGQLPKKELGFIPTGFPVRLEFFVALLAFIAGIAVVFIVGRRRPPGMPLTWGEAMIGATFVFGVLLLGYGVVPNEWMKWADNGLLWRPDRIWFAVSTKWPVFFTGSNAWVMEKIKTVEETMRSDISMDAVLTVGVDNLSVNLTALPLMTQEENGNSKRSDKQERASRSPRRGTVHSFY